MKLTLNTVRTPAVTGLLLMLLAVFISGCATSPVPVSDPDFAPVRPVDSKPLPIETGSIYRSGYEVALFEDTKARQVGDILTVVLQESTNASKKAATNTTKESDIGLAAPTVFGKGITNNGNDILSMDVAADRSFKGEGDTSQSNSLTGTISVTVAEILPNGNLMIRGEKLLTLNQGVEHIRLSGMVRPDDISPENMVPSSKIANARIMYGGQGAVAESNTKGWLQRFVDGPWWPF
jgi:flagellar L-ring protein precursor FlgH